MSRISRNATIACAAGVIFLSSGCAPRAMVDVRNIAGRPLPPGRMAMLPPVLSPVVQYRTLAATFVETTTGDLQKAGIEVTYTTLNGRLHARVLPVRAAGSRPLRAGGPATQPVWMPSPPRYQLLAQAGYVTVCQPTVLRYGYYQTYVPTRVITEPEPYWWGEGPQAPSGDGAFRLARFGVAWKGFERGHRFGERFVDERGDDFGPGDDDWDDWDGGDYWGYGPSYYSAVIPAHYAPAAQIAATFYIFDVTTHQLLYYVHASDASMRYRPAQLEKGFDKPLVKAIREAYAGT